MQKTARVQQILEAAKTRALAFGRQSFPRPLLAVLLVALAAGMLCFIAIPAWWHYDEPGHFEYAWLVAHSPAWPVQGQFDQAMRKEMALSMNAVGWYRIRSFKLDLNSSEPIPIGVTQVGDQPAYYFLASLPLRLLGGAGMTTQYYAARFVSLLLYLLIIVAVWYAGGELLREDQTLRWMTTIFVALLPAFADTMVSVNNDVSAVLATSIFLWASLRLIQKGYSIGRLVFLAASLLGCYLSKSTAWFTFALTPLVLLLALLRGRFAWVVWGLAAAAAVAAGALMLKWGSPKAWFQITPSDYPVRVPVQAAETSLLGVYAFQFERTQPTAVNEVIQIMSPDAVKSLRGKTATLGAWMWADHRGLAGPVFVRFMRQSGDVFDSPHIQLPTAAQPKFHAVEFTVPSDAISGTVYLEQNGGGSIHNTVFFDGLVLARGKFSGSPQYTDANSTQGQWGGQIFQNLVRNPSAEEGSFQARKWVSDSLGGLLTKAGIDLPLMLVTVQDWSGTGWYYRNAAITLFRTFWSSLGGDKAFLASSTVSYFLAFLTLIGLLGALVRLWRHRRGIRWDLVGFLGIALLIPWLLAVAKGNADMLGAKPIAPWARYGYPAIFPTALLLCAGWLELLEIVPGAAKLTPETRKAIFFSLMAGIYVFTLINAIQVFHPGWWLGWVSLGLLFLFAYVIFHLTRGREKLLSS